MEYLLVEFDDDRKLVVDGKPQGLTNLVIELEKGKHIIRLEAPPNDFRPDEIEVNLKDTTSICPEEVRFEKI